jgi:hypothetical protein
VSNVLPCQIYSKRITFCQIKRFDPFSTGIAFSLIAAMIVEKIGRANIIIAGCAFLLMAMGFMTATGLMVYYKAFLLGFFVK